MKTYLDLILASSLLMAIFSYGYAADGNVTHGQELYQSRCFACHSIDANRVGPLHRGVVGRQAGSIADYDYSAALKKSELVWTEENLDRWLSNPEQTIPGQKMGYMVTNAQDRADLIAYLKTQK